MFQKKSIQSSESLTAMFVGWVDKSDITSRYQELAHLRSLHEFILGHIGAGSVAISDKWAAQ